MTQTSKTMIADFEVGEEVTTFVFLTDPPSERLTKKDKPYLVLKCQDTSGVIDSRLWDYPEGFSAKSLTRGQIIKIRGTVSEWNETRQLSISAIRPVNESDQFDIRDIFKAAPVPAPEMMDKLTSIIDERVKSNAPHIHSLLTTIISQQREKFLVAPAAKSVHHAYIAGLLEHVLDMCEIALPIAKHYNLSEPLLLAGIVLHDIGKLFELTYDCGIGYSIEGTLLGHISQGMILVSSVINSIDNFPQEHRVAILHLIASHHGLLQYGSPKVPLMREAIVLNLIDLMSSKMGICARAVESGISAEGLTEWVKELEGPLWVIPND